MDKNAFKIVLIGDSGVGKTSIAFWLVFNKRNIDYASTIGGAFMAKDITIPIKTKNEGEVLEKIRFNIWDTAGQERYRSIAKIYYKNTIGCVCVFDVTNRDSFIHLDRWVNDYLENNILPNYTIILVGNKADHHISQWKITKAEIKEFTEKYHCEYTLTNCITGDGVQETFIILAKSIIDKNDIPLTGVEYKLLDKEESTGIINLATRVTSISKPNCPC